MPLPSQSIAISTTWPVIRITQAAHDHWVWPGTAGRPRTAVVGGRPPSASCGHVRMTLPGSSPWPNGATASYDDIFPTICRGCVRCAGAILTTDYGAVHPGGDVEAREGSAYAMFDLIRARIWNRARHGRSRSPSAGLPLHSFVTGDMTSDIRRHRPTPCCLQMSGGSIIAPVIRWVRAATAGSHHSGILRPQRLQGRREGHHG